MTEHKYGPKGYIVDAFIEHLKQMTRDDWGKVLPAWKSAWNAWAAAGDAVGLAARYAAWFAAWAAAWNAWNTWFAAGDARDVWDAWYTAESVAREAVQEAARKAVWEIQGADLMRERGRPFVFLPLFGFADEMAVLAALQPKEETK